MLINLISRGSWKKCRVAHGWHATIHPCLFAVHGVLSSGDWLQFAHIIQSEQ